METKKTCDNFLHRYGMHYDTIDLSECVDVFIQEMENGLAGKESTLMMLPTYLTLNSEVPLDTPIIVMDAGGTNFRVAVTTFRENNPPSIENFEIYTMPGTQGTIDQETFFDTIAQRLLPVIQSSKKVGFCFSYPTEIQPNRDGKFLKFSKEVSVSGMEGALIGEGINKALVKRGQEEKEFLILNDTVAAMLGGVVGDTQGNADSYIGFILGTGTNTCYVEECRKITKSPAASAIKGSMGVNMESGGYGRFPRGVIDERFDQSTNNPGQFTYEKMVSGAYQGGVIYLTILQAIEDKLFTEAFATDFAKWNKEVPLKEVDQFLDAPIGNNPLAALCRESTDRELLLEILQASYERAAKLVTVNLGAIMQKTGKGKDKNHPVCIAAEGTTFHKSNVFREKLAIYVKSFINETMGLHCRFLKVEDATLLGTAVAGLIG